MCDPSEATVCLTLQRGPNMGRYLISWLVLSAYELIFFLCFLLGLAALLSAALPELIEPLMNEFANELGLLIARQVLIAVGLPLATTGLFGLLVAQLAKASVDTAILTRQLKKIAMEQLEVTKQFAEWQKQMHSEAEAANGGGGEER